MNKVGCSRTESYKLVADVWIALNLLITNVWIALRLFITNAVIFKACGIQETVISFWAVSKIVKSNY